jgi:hypothetical protein
MAIKIIGSTIIDDSRNIVNAGIATVTSVSIGNTQVVSSARQLQNIASLDATTTATIEAAIQNTPNTFTDLSVSGISTLGVTSATNLTAQQLNISGVSTLGITTFTGAVSFGTSAYFGDNDIAYFGNDNDLRIYHSGSNSLIEHIGTNDLYIKSNNGIYLQNATSEASIYSRPNGAVELYYDNSKKFETTGYGATVFGTLQSQQLNVSGISTISVNSSSDALRITQLGSGNALVVEDETNPDSTPFVVSATGSVGVGTTNPTSTLTVQGNAYITGVTTSTDFDSLSDINLKTNISQIADPLEKVMQIRGVTFNWKEGNRNSAGVIAQEIEKVLPELVHGEETKTVNYNGLIGLLIECVKKQQEEIEELKKKVN